MNNPSLVPISMLAAGLGFIVAICARIFKPDVPLIWQISGGVAVVALIAYIFLSRSSIGKALQRKTTRYGINAVWSALVVVAILVFLNLISNEYDVKKDFTKNKVHSLEEQSIKVVKGLQEEIQIKAFIDPAKKIEYQNLFDRYTYYTDKLKVQIVDLERELPLVQSYKITQLGTLIFETPKRSTRVDNLSGPDDPKAEEKLTNAIVSVIKGEKKKMYVISGHGEKTTGDTGPEGFSGMKETLEQGRYKVQDLVLVQSERVPDDAELLLWIDPKSEVLEHEFKLVEDYLKRGGKLLVMLENDSTPSMKPFLAKFGVDVHPKKLLAEKSPLAKLMGSPFVILVANFDRNNEITRDVKVGQNRFLIFAAATPVEKLTNLPSPDLKVSSLFSTSNTSVELEPKDNKVNLDSGKPGQYSLAVSVAGKATAAPAKAEDKKAEDKKAEDKKAEDAKAAEAKKDPHGHDTAKEDKKPEPEYRMVVVGDSNFGSNRGSRMGINGDMFQNMLSWLSKEEDLISLRPKATTAREFNITDDRAWVIHLASVYLLPLIMFASALTVFLSRRRR